MIKIEGVDPKMIANNLTPSELIHPGEILKDEIEYRGISQRKLAAQMGISPTLLNEILNGKRAVSAEYALLFEAALGIDAEPLIKLQVDYNIQVAKSDNPFSKGLPISERLRQYYRVSRADINRILKRVDQSLKVCTLFLCTHMRGSSNHKIKKQYDCVLL